jgi:hypothetical protein
MARFLIEGEMITKMQIFGGVVQKSCSQKPMIQESSDLHESFLT